MTPFALSSSESALASSHHRVAGVFIVGSSMALAASGWMVGSVPLWIQPSAVGAMFASLFLLGLMLGGVGRGNLVFALAALACWLLMQLTIGQLTSLTTAEVLLVTSSLLAFGWITASLECLSSDALARNLAIVQYRQWTIWDIALLTLWAAVFCHCFQRLESPMYLLVEVGYVLMGCAVASWIAYRWAFDDRWSITKFIGFGVVGALALWMVSRCTPIDYSILEVVQWMITGPVAVIFAHGLVVLASLSSIRVMATVLTSGHEFRQKDRRQKNTTLAVISR
jgi:hypothetical protein